MSRMMHDWGRMAAVAGVSAGVGAILGALSISGYRRGRGARSRGLRTDTGMNSSMRSGNSVNDIAPYDDTRREAVRVEADAVRVEAAKMDESPSAFAAGDEVGGDVIGEIHSDDIAKSEFGTSIGTTHLTDSKGSKGTKSKRATNGARARRNVSSHNGRS